MKFFWNFLSCDFCGCQVTRGEGEGLFCLAYFFPHQENEVLGSLLFFFVIFFNGMKMLQILQSGLLRYPWSMTFIQGPSWALCLCVVRILWFLLPSTCRTFKGWHDLTKNHIARKLSTKESVHEDLPHFLVCSPNSLNLWFVTPPNLFQKAWVLAWRPVSQRRPGWENAPCLLAWRSFGPGLG